MKKVVILLFLSFLFVETLFAASSQSQSPSIMADTLPSSEAVIFRPFIYIVAPSENAHLPALSSTFVCGSAPAGGKLWINGTLVSINPGGGFLTMVNLSPGKFEIKAELQVNDEFYHFTRTIFVAGPEQPSPVSPLTIESVTPHPDQEVLPGDLVAVSCKGSPGMKAYFMIKRVELRTPPPLVPGASPLADLTIALDPGHGGTETGAIGATGYLEKDANLAQVLNLKEKLLAKGAKVFLTRQEDVVVSLSERPRIAWQNQADILISLHNNSLQDGGNPFIKHGYGVYYFTPMSLALAKEIHAAYGAAFGEKSEFQLADDGMYYDNLAVTRAPQMPSILIESLYMIVPEEEAYLKTDSFRSVSSNAIINGLERYVRSMHSVESDG
jgi:N-acetylmuramoyl-L-alanine amidase